MKQFVLAMIINLVFNVSVWAETALWKVLRGNAVVYIGGTCHVLRPSDYPLPLEFERAYNESEILVFETHIDKLKSPEVQTMIVTKGMYKTGMGLDTVLSSKTYDNLKAYCQSLGIPLSSLNRFKPSLVVLALIGQEMKKLGVSQGG